MKSTTIFSITFFFLILINNPSYSQSPYEFNPAKEVSLFGGGLGTLGLGLYQRSQTPIFTDLELENLDPNSINNFDRNTTKQYSFSAHNTSDVFWYGSTAMPLLFLAGKKSRKTFGKIYMLYGEVVFVNTGLTLLTKYTVRRARPFVYNNVAPISEKMDANAKASFFSGHTSITAANMFFTASVFEDYYPDSKWKPVVWGAAATIPAITGYLRVKGGRHFPTDVIVGYAVGAAVGYFIPKLHKKKKKELPKF